MNEPTRLTLDTREAAQFVRVLLQRQRGYVPEWQAAPPDIGAALTEAGARFLQAIAQRLNQAPFKNQLAFLDLLGITLIPAQAARAPVVFQLNEKAVDTRLPAGTRVAAPPPPQTNDQIVFETERAASVGAAQLVQVVSLWPGRDQYLDHSATLRAQQPFQVFRKPDLQNVPHVLYLAHDQLLALAGMCAVDVTFELNTPGSEALDLVWEYWDGQVWRSFLNVRPECDDEQAARLDTTKGLLQSGSYHLQTDCAETSQTAVNGVKAYWIRGRLNEPLPPDPARILPEVDSVRLKTVAARELQFVATTPSTTARIDNTNLSVGVQDDRANIFEDAAVDLISGFPSGSQPGEFREGKFRFDNVDFNSPDKILIMSYEGVVGSTVISMDDESSTYELNFVLAAVQPDKGFADQVELELDKTFYPFGTLPQAGATFYLASEEVFSKPGAHVQLLAVKAKTAQDQFGAADVDHTVIWEYWNGRHWTVLAGLQSHDLESTEVIEFDVPEDMASTAVNGQAGWWIRVRLVSGSFAKKLIITTPPLGNPNKPYIVEIPQPPALAGLYLGYRWTKEDFPERVLTYNDFQFQDHTADAKWQGTTFQPFQPVNDVTPALYLGFDKKLPVDLVGIFMDVIEESGEVYRPALRWQYFDGFAWHDLNVEDETRDFRFPGMVSFIAPEDSAPLARFDQPLFWLRGRLQEDGPPGDPTLLGIYPNAVWATQYQTNVEEPVGVSTGQPNQVFQFRQFPVLADEEIQVREVAGLRANVEWRIVAAQVLGDVQQVRQVEALLAREGTGTTVEYGALRLTRDRTKRVTEVWVRWQGVKHLLFSQAADRHYVVDRARGLIFFGDGTNGQALPAGAQILARRYRAGGGAAGNVRARGISQMLGPIGGIEGTFNPRPAEGGADGETIATLATRGPQTVRHRGRAVSAPDFEVMAKEASASVAFARALGCTDAGGHYRPGWVKLIIIPHSADPRPYPSFGLRQQVQTYLERYADAEIAALDQVLVTGPDYIPVDIEATIVPINPSDAGAVQVAARQALMAFLHPLYGGPDNDGWRPGRSVFLSDVAAVVERVAGVDYVTELALLVDSELQGDSITVPPDRIVVAGEVRIKLVQGVA